VGAVKNGEEEREVDLQGDPFAANVGQSGGGDGSAKKKKGSVPMKCPAGPGPRSILEQART